MSLPPRTHQEPDNYWDPVTDPDGRSRDRLNEEEAKAYLANIREELKFIEGLKPGKVLDVGCGPGWLLSAIDPAWEKYLTKTAGLILSQETKILKPTSFSPIR